MSVTDERRTDGRTDGGLTEILVYNIEFTQRVDVFGKNHNLPLFPNPLEKS